MPRFTTATDIINRAAVECGLLPEPDPIASQNETFIQMEALLNSAGQELVELHPWEQLISQYHVATSAADTGHYDLPSDFAYMIDQTGWEFTNTRPMVGPLTPQTWTYLRGRDLVTSSIYASFRLSDGKLDVYPNDPVPDGLDINFEYINRNWVRESGSLQPRDEVQVGSDVILFQPTMMVKLLKIKYLEANGFDSTAARMEFDTLFQSETAKDAGAQIVSAGGSQRGYPYLDTYYSTPDTGYGL